MSLVIFTRLVYVENVDIHIYFLDACIVVHFSKICIVEVF